MQGAIFSRPTWQGLFLQSCCISSIHGGQMWGVRKMQGAIFCRPTWQGLFLQSCCISSIHGGQMWGVRKMQGAIFSPSIHGHSSHRHPWTCVALCHPWHRNIPSIHGHALLFAIHGTATYRPSMDMRCSLPSMAPQHTVHPWT